ncbi:MAG TPA: cupin, partial [Eubacterium sp.]|nr:cupin [Eubacterium sp.]
MDRWREKNGEVFSIPKDNPTVPGCTISKSVFSGEENNLIYFSLAEDTSISAETYQNPKLLILNSGSMTVFTPEGAEQKMQAG